MSAKSNFLLLSFPCYLLLLILSNYCNAISHCQNANKLKYVWGDAFSDADDCLGPNNKPYPIQDVLKIAKRLSSNHRTGRTQRVLDPYVTRDILLKSHNYLPEFENGDLSFNSIRKSRSLDSERYPKNELCRVTYNTTTPKYGYSLTSGKLVAIIQKFPDFLQQAIYEKCDCTEYSIIMGECKQTFSPRLMHVLPFGPVTTIGQDYILIESGCRMQLHSKQQENQCKIDHNFV